MKIATVTVLSFFVFFVPTSAHIGGTPILKINGEFGLPDLYSNTRPYDTVRDRPPRESYEIGSIMEFEIDLTELQDVKSILEKSKLIWDFGDGSPREEGIGVFKKQHIYSTEGRYDLIIFIDSTSAGFEGMVPEAIQFVTLTIGNPPPLVVENRSPSKYEFIPMEEVEARRKSKALRYALIGGGVPVIGYILVAAYLTLKKKKLKMKR